MRDLHFNMTHDEILNEANKKLDMKLMRHEIEYQKLKKEVEDARK